MDALPTGVVTSGSVIGLLLVLLASMIYGLWKALMNGTLITSREAKEKDARIAAQTRTITTLENQVTLMLTETLTAVIPVLKAMRKAAQAEAEEDDP